MCGGDYKRFKIPKQLLVVNKEPLAVRTIRLLKEHGVNEEDIYISSNNPMFDSCGVTRLENRKNDFTTDSTITFTGYWLDAFYPSKEPTTYLFGDVYFTEDAIKTIVNYKTDRNVLFGTSDAKNEQHENWGEPFAYIVNDTETFFKGVNDVKKLHDKGKIKRHPIVWELYRYLHDLDINIQTITTDYECIDDGTMDVDTLEELEEIRKRVGV